jgi:hypothetical protein
LEIGGAKMRPTFFVRWRLAIEGGHHSQYDPTQLEHVIAEAAGVIRALGFAGKHVVLIGGIVPSLLIPVLDPALEPHVGTRDLDFCLSAAIVEGDTAEYERIERNLRQAGFEATDESWRWRGGDTGNVLIEFFCPANDERPAGKLFRPAHHENPLARHNLGRTLSALALEMGGFIDQDVQIVEREMDLPRGQGRMTVSMRVIGPAGFLALKASALNGRRKPKDAYDIIWLLDAWEGGPEGIARYVRERSFYLSSDFGHVIDILADQFRDVGHAGAIAYADFVTVELEDRDIHARHAVDGVQQFLRRVRQ